MRYLFGNGSGHPDLVCSLNNPEKSEIIATMRNAVFDGADGFLLHIEALNQEYRNKESLNEIFKYAEDKPVLALDYRREGRTDAENASMLIEAIDAGADYIDVFADMFDAHEGICYTDDTEAVKKQKEVIEKAHSMGGRVMTSAHIFNFVEPDKVLEMALNLESRGADIVKIAAQVTSEDELLRGIYLTTQLRKNLKVPFLHICMGQYGKVHRVIAPLFGSCMVLCVQQYTAYSHKDKPLLRAVREIYGNLDYKRFRD